AGATSEPGGESILAASLAAFVMASRGWVTIGVASSTDWAGRGSTGSRSVGGGGKALRGGASGGGGEPGAGDAGEGVEGPDRSAASAVGGGSSSVSMCGKVTSRGERSVPEGAPAPGAAPARECCARSSPSGSLFFSAG